jgi:hypothetical protein
MRRLSTHVRFLTASIVAMLVLGLATVIPVHAALDQKVFITTSTTAPIQSTINDYIDTVHVGDTFTVYLMYSNMTDLWGIQYWLTWNSTILSVTRIVDTMPWPSVFIALNTTTAGLMKFSAVDTGSTGYNETVGFGNVVRKILFQILLAPPSGVGSNITTSIAISHDIWGNSVPANIPHDTISGTFNYASIIGTPSQSPATNVGPSQPVKVSVNVTDTVSTLENVTLVYTTDGGTTWTNRLMSYNATSKLYEGTIPGQAGGTTVQYKIVAFDVTGSQATNDNAGAYYVYPVVAEFPPALILVIFAAVTLFAVVLTKKRKPS